MADLSEHFGRFDEFLIRLLGLFLLILMHPAPRRFLRERVVYGAHGAARLYMAADARSKTVHRWTIAFQLMFRERRDLLLIVLALVAFDYAAGFYGDFVRSRILAPAYENRGFEGEVFQDLFATYQFLYGFITYFGYTLFAWLAFRRAQGATYREAQTFAPILRIFALFLLVVGADRLTVVLAPWVIASFEWIKEPIGILGLAGSLAVGGVVSLIGARFFRRPFNGKIAVSTVSALAGFLVLTTTTQWFYYVLSLAPLTGPHWLTTLNGHAASFTYTLLWNILMTGFVVVLADPTREPASALHEPAQAV